MSWMLNPFRNTIKASAEGANHNGYQNLSTKGIAASEPMKRKNDTIIALLRGPDSRGIVAKVSGWIYERGGNIIDADQHYDRYDEVFFQRIEWAPKETTDIREEREDFIKFAGGIELAVDCQISSVKPRVAIFVSRYDHCFHELFLGQNSGELPCEIACVISNHPDLREATEIHGVAFYHIPVTRENKEEAELRQLEILWEYGVDLVVMARYMQILSANFLRDFGNPVMNIHHSFLPAFAGGRPYQQAYQRGVKLIGATAHYATAILDDGPIIQQDVERVSHRRTVKDLVVLGRILERRVLLQAVRWHLEHRILIYGRKTVVFD